MIHSQMNSGPEREARTATISENDAACVAERLRAWTGIKLDCGKTALMRRRLLGRMRELNMDRVRQYLALVDSSAKERQSFISLLTTNETRFFRTARVWTYLEDEFLPEWTRKRSGVLKIWSAASSSGEEAYSLAMLCADWQEKNGAFDYHIWASDIDLDRVEQCRKGLYSGRSESALREYRPGWAERFTRATPEGLEILPKLKKKIEFSAHNLLKPWPGSPEMNLVLLRNVLIYFASPEFVTTVGNVWETMAPGSVLILGESESLSHEEDALRANGVCFEFVSPQLYRKASTSNV
jgi:chemotaxis protein methyltransferase CheR